jgi:hypothetical protein
MSQQLAEVLPFDYTIVEQAKRSGVLLTLEGTFQRAGTKNANGRIYPVPLWQKLMANDDVNERLKARRMLGELDHPASGATSLSRVAHVVTEHKLLDDNRVKGRLDILDTPMGQIASTLAKAGVQLGVSSRGDGSVERKGDVDEVQNDFRLETYDLVLKPSTPGAYPQIIESEEKAQENLDLIAQAVEGLVKSTHEVDVLLECHKLISVLEGCESRRESILAELKARLSKGQVEQPQTQESEDDMSGTTVPAPAGNAPVINPSPETLAWMEEWVSKGVNEAVAEKDVEIGKLNERIVGLSAEKDDLTQKVTAAEELIDEFTRKVKELGDHQSTDEELQERFDASVELLDEAMSRLQELGETQRRLAAAEELLTASIYRHQMESVAAHIEEKIEDLNEESQDKVRKLLEDCSTTEDVDAKFEQLESFLEDSSSEVPDPQVREPLPPRQGSIQEDVVTETTPPAGPKDFITSRLLAKMSG